MAFVAGFLVGVSASVAYIVFGQWEGVFFVPAHGWAQVVFFPGVTAGHAAYPVVRQVVSDWDLAVVICMGIGALVMGCTVGLIFAGVSALGRLVLGWGGDGGEAGRTPD